MSKRRKGRWRALLAVILLLAGLGTAHRIWRGDRRLAGQDALSFFMERYDEAVSKCLVRETFSDRVGNFTPEELRAAAVTVYGEASPDEGEHCAIAQVIFNRFRARGSKASDLIDVVQKKGQFLGYWPHAQATELDCPQLNRAAGAVRKVAEGRACDDDVADFQYFCSFEGFKRVAPHDVTDMTQKLRARRAKRIGASVFIRDEPC